MPSGSSKTATRSISWTPSNPTWRELLTSSRVLYRLNGPGAGSWPGWSSWSLHRELKCRMTGGASGGPWFFPFSDGDGTVMSVNSYRYSGGDALYGPKFNANTQAVYEAAKTTTASCIEPYLGAVGWPARYANSATVPYAKRLCPG